MREYLREVASGLTVWAIVALLGLLGAYLASLTPKLELFAPFSYFVAFFVSVTLASVVTIALVRAKDALWPNDSSRLTISTADPSISHPPGESAVAQSSIELLEGIDGELTKQLSPFARRLSAIESQMPLIEGTLQKLRESIPSHAASLEDALTDKIDQFKFDIDPANLHSELRSISIAIDGLKSGIVAIVPIMELASATRRVVNIRTKIEQELDFWIPNNPPEAPFDLIENYVAAGAELLSVAKRCPMKIYPTETASLTPPISFPENWEAVKGKIERVDKLLFEYGFDANHQLPAIRRLMEPVNG